MTERDFEVWEPGFKSTAEIQDELVKHGFFTEKPTYTDVSNALMELVGKHNIGYGGNDKYEVTEKHLPVLTQYIDAHR